MTPSIKQLLLDLQHRAPELTAERIAAETGFEPKQILEMRDGKAPARAQGKKTTSRTRGYVFANADLRYRKLGDLIVEHGQGLVDTADQVIERAYAEQCGRAKPEIDPLMELMPRAIRDTKLHGSAGMTARGEFQSAAIAAKDVDETKRFIADLHKRPDPSGLRQRAGVDPNPLRDAREVLLEVVYDLSLALEPEYRHRLAQILIAAAAD